MDIKEIVNLLYTAIDLAADGGPGAFTEEEYSEMHELLKKIKSCKFGWHPSSEVPQINKKVVGITTNGKAQEEVYYDGNRYCWNGLTIKIKWWCYQPDE